MKNITKLILAGLLTVTVLSGTAVAQSPSGEKEPLPDTLKIYVGYSNQRVDDVQVTFPNGVTIPVPIIETHAITGTASVKAFSRSRFSFRFAGKYTTNVNRHLFHQYSGGTQVFFKLFENRIEPFGQLLFGVHRVNAENHFMKTYGGGIDVRVLRRFGFRVIEFNRYSIDNFPKRGTELSSGLFFVF